MSKLQLCVSEVEWTTFKPLLCHPCIKRLNIAYSFKKQCVQSAGVLKNYVELVKESQKKNESQNVAKVEQTLPQGGTYMLLPHQKYVKILVGSQNQGTTGNTFQNVFLNLIPTTSLTTVPNNIDNGNVQKNKDTNQNVFLNLNNTFQKFIPITSVDPPPLKKTEITKKEPDPVHSTSITVNQLLIDSNAEEMSVEIDPTSFLSLEHEEPSNSTDGDDFKADWDELIIKQKIDPKNPKLNGTIATNGKGNVSNFVPILPKEDFFLSGAHFLSGSFQQGDFNCETCQKTFPSVKILKQHIKHYHLGKLPFKCENCYSEFLTREEYNHCLKRHNNELDCMENNSLTLKDFSGNAPYENDALSISIIAETPADHNLVPNENGDYVCDVCKRIFNSSTGLLRHKVRKHHQKNRKKYFIKGMKNAKCDICNREFSTQSYMQLHRKLHLRDDIGYKYKVLGKSKYKEISDTEGDDAKNKEENGEGDLKKDSEGNESGAQDTDSSSENEIEIPKKNRKLESDRAQNSIVDNDTCSNNIRNLDEENETDSSDEESLKIDDQLGEDDN
ncbi:hypothetical protein GWI33_017693 [Rhynchophorus ferrugineus]|uniref:C2H2-type domain-containing protein n=1 Tax=Rhynchophorus ferrugineus TaxID=354439 RepID=A0A834M5Y4_RHYFE|nr:hypothetical protein GWI33_017693 [Rhynchophorus ferrugineus]